MAVCWAQVGDEEKKSRHCVTRTSLHLLRLRRQAVLDLLYQLGTDVVGEVKGLEQVGLLAVKRRNGDKDKRKGGLPEAKWKNLVSATAART